MKTATAKDTLESLPTTGPDAELIQRLGVPFAHALAAFMIEYERLDRGGSRQEAARTPAPVNRLGELGLTQEDLDVIERDRALDARGELEKIAIEDIDPIPLVAARIREVLAERGMTQSDLAKRLEVNASVVSRVLSRPDRAKVATLRRIAEVLDIELYEVI